MKRTGWINAHRDDADGVDDVMWPSEEEARRYSTNSHIAVAIPVTYEVPDPEPQPGETWRVHGVDYVVVEVIDTQRGRAVIAEPARSDNLNSRIFWLSAFEADAVRIDA